MAEAERTCAPAKRAVAAPVLVSNLGSGPGGVDSGPRGVDSRARGGRFKARWAGFRCEGLGFKGVSVLVAF